jgi:predicted Zn-dependent protease
LYEAVAGETRDPEFMDAVARLRRQGPEPASAQAWIERAAAAHRQRLELLPEAALGHALEHELWFGQPEQALALARRNAALRPNGESRILLAEALFRAGHASEAGQEIQAVQDSAWDTAELHAIAAQIAAGLGRRDDADAQRALALALNPRAFRMYPLPQPAQPEAVP